jgi:hypothetical protein
LLVKSKNPASAGCAGGVFGFFPGGEEGRELES